ncbi:T-cell immunomodulatory protein, putative, partial [Eimeria tenella]
MEQRTLGTMAAAASLTDEDLAACGLSSIHPLAADLTFDHYPDLLVQTAAPAAASSSSSSSSSKGQFRFFWENLASKGLEGFAPRRLAAAADLFETSAAASVPEQVQQQQQQQQQQQEEEEAEALITNPHSSAVADIDGDCRADLLL